VNFFVNLVSFAKMSVVALLLALRTLVILRFRNWVAVAGI